MYKNILLMKNGCEGCNLESCLGVLLAKSLEAKVTGMYVSEAFSRKEIRDIYNPDELKWPGAAKSEKEALENAEKCQKQIANEALEGVEKSCAALGVEFEKVYLSGESPVNGVLKVANDRHCDLIFTSTHPHGLKDLVFEAIEAKILGQSKIPVVCHHCG